MASSQHMPRRGLLKAAVSAPLVAALVAGNVNEAAALCFAGPAETPVAKLFREWQATERAANLAEGDEYDRLHEHRFDLEERMIATPSQNARDVVLKIVAWSVYGDCTFDNSDNRTQPVWSEIDALVA